MPLVALLAAGAGRRRRPIPRDRPGLAAITADMLDEGSGDRSAIEMHEALGRIGAQLDTDIGSDATRPDADDARAVRRARPRAARRHASCGRASEAREFERVRQLRLHRLTQLRDMPPAVADRAFTQLLYGEHPYGHLPIGTEASLAA